MILRLAASQIQKCHVIYMLHNSLKTSLALGRKHRAQLTKMHYPVNIWPFYDRSMFPAGSISMCFHRHITWTAEYIRVS